MKVCVIGCGYIGLITATCLAELGHEVVCCDVDEHRIGLLRKGIVPIHEPGIVELVKKHTTKDKELLFFSHHTSEAITYAEIIFICVNTPPTLDGSLNMGNIWNVAKQIGCNLNDYKVVVQKSTVPMGTARKITQVIKDNRITPVDFDVVANPEFLREGNAVLDFLNGDRVVIGCESWRGSEKLIELYATLPSRAILTTLESAEMIKYASNAFLAMKISYINSIARICEKTGADVKEVAIGMGSDHRIGEEFLNAGLGYGGSCFGKDNRALIHLSNQLGIDFDILKAVEIVNEQQISLFIEKIKNTLGDLNKKKIGILGLSFKPNTDDIRDSRSIKIIQLLKQEGAVIQAYDPKAMRNMAGTHYDILYCGSPIEAAKDADAVVLVTEWSQFLEIDFHAMKAVMKTPIVFDGRNLYDPMEMKSQGFDYHGIGR